MIKENKDMTIENLTLEEIAQEIINTPTDVQVEVEEDARSTDEMNEDTVKTIVSAYASKYKTDHRTAICAITKIVQDGGTNTSRPNMTRKIKNIDFELADLRQIIRIHDKFGTVRKLAKSMKKIIAAVSKINKWSGPLYKDIQRLNPNLIISEAESVYCAEFNADNYDSEMPARIREALQQREAKIRDNRTKFGYAKLGKRIKSGKRKRGRDRKYQ